MIRRAEASDYEAFRHTFEDEGAYSGTLQLPFPLYRKRGFEVEGTHKACALRAGRWADVHAMARIRFKPPG